MALITQHRRPRVADKKIFSLVIVDRRISELRAASGNARTHTEKQIGQLAAAMKRFGYISPILIDEVSEIIAGHGRMLAAKLLGLPTIPTVTLAGLSPPEKRGLALADNKIAQNAGWDVQLLAVTLKELSDSNLDFDVLETGFDTVEIDNIISDAEQESDADAAADAVPPVLPHRQATRPGDAWILGSHVVVCGSALERPVYRDLMGTDQARMAFLDPPYNVPISGHVSGLGRRTHREFAMAAGEMSFDEFMIFLKEGLLESAACCIDGAILYACMDWRHLEEMITAGRLAGLTLKNLIVWSKTNGGMGTFYRSAHELILPFKKGKAPHVNNFGLGASGRYRTNVWEYPGANAFGRNRASDLDAHPTAKPTAMIADAIKDVSNRGDIVIDSFGGSGSTLIAAEKTQRRARVIELDPLYVDVIVRRWEAYTGETARHAETNQTFREVETIRSESNVPR